MSKMPTGLMCVYGAPGCGKTALVTSMPRTSADKVLYFAIDPAAQQLKSVPQALRPPPECVLSRDRKMPPYNWLERLSRIQWSGGDTIKEITVAGGKVGPVVCNKELIIIDTFTTWANEVLDEVGQQGLYNASGARYFKSGSGTTQSKVGLWDEGTYGTTQNCLMTVANQFQANNPDSLVVFIGHSKWMAEKGTNNLSSNKGGIDLPGKALLEKFLAPMHHVIFCAKQDGKYTAAIEDCGVWLAKTGRDFTQPAHLSVNNDITGKTMEFWDKWLLHVGETQ